MENNKYYTPEIEEFHVGFEYEWSEEGRKIWIDEIGDIDDIILVYETYQKNIDEYNNSYRVKLLDREDIEAGGWEYDSTVKNEGFFQHKSTNMLSKYNWWLTYREKENTVDIYDMNKNPESFYGEIKNKSQLKMIMKMLKIE